MAAVQLQALLRFLSQDAKIPLASAMGKVRELQKAKLASAEEISKSDLQPLQDIFQDERVAKQVLNAAKRVSKKRTASSAATNTSVSSTVSERKKPRRGSNIGTSQSKTSLTPYEIECSLALPEGSFSEDELRNTVILTNRAPLVLAFAVCLLKYTMPEQPISSRLSLAQTVVSANSRSKAVSIGLESGKSAEDEGWGQGQPTVRVLGREIPILKRWDYDPDEGRPTEVGSETEKKSYRPAKSTTEGGLPPVWGLDLEVLRKSSEPQQSNKQPSWRPMTRELPIHTPEDARTYLFKSFHAVANVKTEIGDAGLPSKKTSGTLGNSEKESCLTMLLQAIDMLCQSWAGTLSPEDLDKRAWSWYLQVRPDVRSGAAGWGEKGHIKLADLLILQRQQKTGPAVNL